MRVCLVFGGTVVHVMVRAQTGATVGDMTEHVRPGDTFLGHSYDELRALGEGAHDIQPKDKPKE